MEGGPKDEEGSLRALASSRGRDTQWAKVRGLGMEGRAQRGKEEAAACKSYGSLVPDPLDPLPKTK